MTFSKRFALALASCLVAAGCAASTEDDASFDMDDMAESLDTLGASTVGTTDKLDPACFWSKPNQERLRLFGRFGLTDSSGVLYAELMPTTGCTTVIKQAVRCALSVGQTVKAPDGTVFEGSLGLAPEWKSGPISQSGEAWVTACMAQGLGLPVNAKAYELDGASPSLSSGVQPLQSEETVAESTAYGNLFDGAPLGGTDPAFTLSVCASDDLADSCGGKAEMLLRDRICGKSDLCGLSYIGKCSERCDVDAQGNAICDDVIETIELHLSPEDTQKRWAICGE